MLTLLTEEFPELSCYNAKSSLDFLVHAFVCYICKVVVTCPLIKLIVEILIVEIRAIKDIDTSKVNNIIVDYFDMKC